MKGLVVSFEKFKHNDSDFLEERLEVRGRWDGWWHGVVGRHCVTPSTHLPHRAPASTHLRRYLSCACPPAPPRCLRSKAWRKPWQRRWSAAASCRKRWRACG